jgi:hypothetical protein
LPAAIAIPAIIGAAGVGTQLVGAKMGSNAAKNAAQAQIASTDKAQAFTERAYQDQQRALAPYMQAGQQSLGSLMGQYGGKPLQNPYAPSGMSAQGQPEFGGMPQGQPQGGGMSLGSAMGQPRPQGQPMQAPPMQAGAPAGGMVRVKAPTGEVAMMQDGPQLQMALQRGAVRI